MERAGVTIRTITARSIYPPCSLPQRANRLVGRCQRIVRTQSRSLAPQITNGLAARRNWGSRNKSRQVHQSPPVSVLGALRPAHASLWRIKAASLTSADALALGPRMETLYQAV